MDSSLESAPLESLPKITIENPQDLRRLYSHGRETDLMHLESALLLGKKPVFLEEHSQTDLQRNALVFVFLRVLEYYEGILIFTSNRGKEFHA